MPILSDPAAPSTKRQELAAFLLTTFLVIPALAVGFVGAYGFAVWIYQIIFGPPGPPA
jgi:nitrate reductase NapE